MLYAGCDLHKQTISICVVNPARQIVKRQRLMCANEESVRRFFEELGECEAVVEATASYEWFVRLIEPYARRVVLAHPKKLRVIAESTRKSDQLDAQVLAEFLALDMIPASYRPTPRQREHRQLVRQRDRVQRRLTSVKNRIRRMLANYNADRPRLFNAEGLVFLKQIPLSAADRFSMNQFLEEYDFGQGQLKAATSQIEMFAAASPIRERELRELLRTIPGVGFVTAEVILAELADITRFRSQSQVVAYAGLAPGQRESAGKCQELHLEKTRLKAVAVDAGRGGLAAGAALAALERDLRKAEGPHPGQEGDRGRGPSSADVGDGDPPDWPSVLGNLRSRNGRRLNRTD